MFAFVVPTYSRTDLLGRLVQSLKTHEPDFGRWKLVIVHDGGPTTIRNWISQAFGQDPQIHLILKHQNEGFARTVNAGMLRALELDADRIVLTNDDIQFRAPVINAFEKAFQDPKTGIVGAKLVYPNGMIQHAGMRRSGGLIGHRFCGMDGDLPQANQPGEIFVTGALMGLRTSMVREIGSLDPDYFMACEDVDYCMKAATSGWKVMYWPAVSAIHSEGASRGRTDRQKGPKFVQAEREGYNRLRSKWGHRLREFIRVDGRKPVAYIFLHGSREQVLAQPARLQARGWPAFILTVGPGHLEPAQAVQALKAFRGTKIACSLEAVPWVVEGLQEGDAGFVYVDDALAYASAVPSRLKLRPLCEQIEVARAIGIRYGVDPAVVATGAPGEAWPEAITRLEDILDHPHPIRLEAGGPRIKSFGSLGQDAATPFTSAPQPRPAPPPAKGGMRVVKRFGKIGSGVDKGFNVSRRRR